MYQLAASSPRCVCMIAGVKGRNPFGWGILGLFFSILTLIVIVIIPTKKKN